MARLTECPELYGFFSYSREDDRGFHNELSALRIRIQDELRAQLGRTPRNFRLWQDKEAIAAGKIWQAEIETAVGQSVFFIPIITPTFVASEFCGRELESFLGREKSLDRSDLIFPILYMDVPELEDSDIRHHNSVLSLITQRQYSDWRRLRHRDVQSTDVKEAVERFCVHIRDALRRAWKSPEDRKQQEEAAARQQAEDETARREQEVRRKAAEEEARKEAEAQARDRAAAEQRKREAAAEQRHIAEAEAKRRKEEARQKAEAKARKKVEDEARRREEEARKKAAEEKAREKVEAEARERAKEEAEQQAKIDEERRLWQAAAEELNKAERERWAAEEKRRREAEPEQQASVAEERLRPPAEAFALNKAEQPTARPTPISQSSAIGKRTHSRCVYVAYEEKDELAALVITTNLREAGLECFKPFKANGSPSFVTYAINNALDDAGVMIVIRSKQSTGHGLDYELDGAKRRNIPILSVDGEDVLHWMGSQSTIEKLVAQISGLLQSNR
jgi:TIR domain